MDGPNKTMDGVRIGIGTEVQGSRCPSHCTPVSGLGGCIAAIGGDDLNRIWELGEPDLPHQGSDS